jgi:hypothetical protein
MYRVSLWAQKLTYAGHKDDRAATSGLQVRGTFWKKTASSDSSAVFRIRIKIFVEQIWIKKNYTGWYRYRYRFSSNIKNSIQFRSVVTRLREILFTFICLLNLFSSSFGLILLFWIRIRILNVLEKRSKIRWGAKHTKNFIFTMGKVFLVPLKSRKAVLTLISKILSQVLSGQSSMGPKKGFTAALDTEG